MGSEFVKRKSSSSANKSNTKAFVSPSRSFSPLTSEDNIVNKTELSSEIPQPDYISTKLDFHLPKSAIQRQTETSEDGEKEQQEQEQPDVMSKSDGPPAGDQESKEDELTLQPKPLFPSFNLPVVQRDEDNSEQKEPEQKSDLISKSDAPNPGDEEHKEDNVNVQTAAETASSQSEEEDNQENLNKKSIQTKLTVGKPGDKYEQEADATAAKVMTMSDETVQRQTEEEKNLTPDPSPMMERGEEIQTKGKGNKTEVSSSLESRLGSSKGGGSPLPDNVRSFMEPRFGADFSGVNVHTDSSAVQMNKELGAQAFAHGNDIYYGGGKSPGNDELTAHELTHTIQQTGGIGLQKRHNNKQEIQFKQEENDIYIQAKQIIPALTFTKLSNKNSLQTQKQQQEETTKTKETAGGQDEAEQAAREIAPAEREQKKVELIAKKQPKVDQKKQKLDEVGQKAQQASQKAEQPSKSKGKAQAKEPPKEQKAHTGAAAQAANVAKQTFAQANSQALPEKPAAVVTPEPVTPVDSGGMPLPGNPEADAQISNLAQQAQSLRDGGHQLLAQAAQIRTNAQIIRGNIQLVKQGIGQSEQGVATSTEHLTFRQESVEQAKQALQVSEQKASTVAEQAPGFVDKSNQGQEKTQPMVSEANQLAGESAAKTPDDPEAAGKSREQGQKLNQVASDTATMDEAFTKTRTKAESLAAEAAQAQGMNTQTSTKIGEMEATLGQSQERLTQMGEQNQQARTQAESLEGKPDEMVNQAAVLEEKGQALIQASIQIEQQLQQIQAEYQQAISSVPAAETGEQTGESETGVIQRDVEEGRYDERENIDLVGASPDWLTGVDPATEEQRQAAAQAAEVRRQEQIAQINGIAGGSFENLSAGQKIGISLQLMGQNIYDSLSNIQWPDWRTLATSLIDPRTALTGVLSGLSQILSGGANLLSGEQWSKDPLGNFLKSAADIATGLTVILGSITALAGVITALMGAITLVSLGTAAPVTGPIIAFCATVMTTVGAMTFKVGLVAAGLHGLVLIKNLVDAATAETAGDLQNQSEQMTEDVKNAGGALLQAGAGKLAQWGGRHLQGKIAQAGGGTAYAAGIPGRVAAIPGRMAAGVQQKVSGARQWLGQRLGRGKPTTSTPATSTPDVGLANRGYRPQPGERSMTREQWRAQDRARRAGRSVTGLDEPLGGTYHHGPHAGQPRMGHTAKRHRAAKTNRQLRDRATSSNIPAATRFANDPTHLRVVNIMKREASSSAIGRTNGTHNLGSGNGTLRIRGRNGNTPTIRERLVLQGREFEFTTGRGFYANNAPAGHVAGTPTGALNRATLVLEMTGVDSAGNPIYTIVTAHPSL